MMVNDVRAQEFTQVVFFTITCNTYEKIITVEPPASGQPRVSVRLREVSAYRRVKKLH